MKQKKTIEKNKNIPKKFNSTERVEMRMEKNFMKILDRSNFKTRMLQSTFV